MDPPCLQSEQNMKLWTDGKLDPFFSSIKNNQKKGKDIKHSFCLFESFTSDLNIK